MINVLYDISVLSIARVVDSSRTGVARVAENLLWELAAAPGVELGLCTSALPQIFWSSELYAREHSVLAAARVVRPPVIEMGLYRWLMPPPQRLTEREPPPTGVKQVGRRAVALARRGIEALRGTIPPRELAEAEVFHSPFFGLPWQVRRDRRIRRFLTVHDLISVLHPNLAPSGRTIARMIRTLRPGDWALCVSQATKDDLCHYRPDLSPERMVVTHLAAGEHFRPCQDAETRLAARRKYRIPDAAPYFFSLNTLDARKNMVSVIRAFARMAQQAGMQEVHLVLAGGKGWKFDELTRELDRFPESRSRIILTGFVPDADLPALYSDAVAFVYPSLYEGFGLPTLEAMQCGTPVITSNTSSLPEVVGDAAIKVPPTDLDALSQAMIDVCQSESLRRDYSARGRERAGMFSWQKCASETVAAYARAIAE